MHPPAASAPAACWRSSTASATARARTATSSVWRTWAQNIKATALCGLGQTAPNPVLSTIKQFRHEYEAHIYDKHCPAGVCKMLLNYVIDPEKCRGCTLCARVCPTGSISGKVKEPHSIDPKKLHQVRRLYGEVQVWRHLQEVSKEVAIDGV